jgi:collagenase-like PrtC family protease
MTDTCKHQIKDKKASTWNNKVFRNCQVKAGASGYCARHDPENIAEAEAAESQREIIAEMREVKRKEEAVMGLFMRLRRPEEFAALLADLREAETVATEMRYARW